MKKDFTESVIKELQAASAKEHADFFRILKEFTADRLSKVASDLEAQSNELKVFLKDIVNV